LSALSRQTEEDESEYLKENDKKEGSKPKFLGKETKEEKTSVKESTEESIKAGSDSPEE
jgi:hypothetical protein